MKPYYQDDACQIFLGDCLEILPTLTENSIRLLWTDPPYGHGNHNGDLNDRLNNHRGIDSNPIQNDDMDSFKRVFDTALTQSIRLLCDDCCCCCGGGPRPTFAYVANRMDQLGLSFFHSVIWDKLNPGLGWRFRRQHEMIMVAHKINGKLAWVDNEIAVPNIIKISPPRNRIHPNEKPISIPKLFISLTTTKNEIILDPFMGSGTTLRAAKDLGRKAIGIELEEKYCEIAARRLEQEILNFDKPKTKEMKQLEIV